MSTIFRWEHHRSWPDWRKRLVQPLCAHGIHLWTYRRKVNISNEWSQGVAVHRFCSACDTNRGLG